MDYKLEYWIEMVSSALEEANVEASKEQIIKIASDIRISADQTDLAFGRPCESYLDPHSECKIKEEKLKREIEEWKGAFRNNVSIRRGVSNNDVTIYKDGHAEIRP